MDKPAYDYRGREYKTGDIYANSVNGWLTMFKEKQMGDKVDKFVSDYYPRVLNVREDLEPYKVFDPSQRYGLRTMTEKELYEYGLEKAKKFDTLVKAYYATNPIGQKERRIDAMLQEDSKQTRDDIYKQYVAAATFEQLRKAKRELTDRGITSEDPNYEAKLGKELVDIRERDEIKREISEINTLSNKAAFATMTAKWGNAPSDRDLEGDIQKYNAAIEGYKP